MLRKSSSFRILAGLAGVALCCLAATSTLAALLHDRSAQIALRLAPFDAQAMSGTASELLRLDQSQETLAEVRGLARRALMREPVNVVAIRVMGLAASIEADQEAARAYFRLASRLSKRDLPSQLWWIELEAGEGDITGALTYYDEALRTSRSAADRLMPILIEASAEPLVAEKLLPFLERRPTYRRRFFIEGTDTASDVSGVAILGRQVLDRGDSDDQDLINRIITRFGRDGDLDGAWSMFVWARGRPDDESLVNGSFDEPVPFRLFNWELTQSEALSAEIAPRGETDSLFLTARVSRGAVARQLLRLKPGRYVFNAVVGDVPAAAIDRPTITIACVGSGATVMGPVAFSAGTAGQAEIRQMFDIDSRCRYQSLDLAASAASQDEVRTWIDDIVIRLDR